MKKVFFVMIIFIMLFAFCGCAEVVYSYYSTEAGERILEWKVTLDGESLEHTGADIPDTIKELMEAEAASRVSQGRNAEVIYSEDNPYVITLRESYPSLTDMYLAFNLTGDEENEILNEEKINLLFSEVTNKMDFASQSEADYFNTLFSSYFAPIYADPSAVTLQYRYGTTYNTVYGLDYDDTYVEDAVTFYVWDLDVENIDATSIVVAQRIPRIWIWEAGAILASALVIGGAALLTFIRRKQNA